MVLPLLSKITNRRLLQVTGKDCLAVLKGITTTNVDSLMQDEEKAIQHTLFLNNKGKILSDCFVIKPFMLRQGKIVGRTGEVWLESQTDMVTDLEKHIKQIAFRKEVIVKDVSDQIDTLYMYSPALMINDKKQRGTLYRPFFGDEADYAETQGDQSLEFAAVDPRCENLGLRIYSLK